MKTINCCFESTSALLVHKINFFAFRVITEFEIHRNKEVHQVNYKTKDIKRMKKFRFKITEKKQYH